MNEKLGQIIAQGFSMNIFGHRYNLRIRQGTGLDKLNLSTMLDREMVYDVDKDRLLVNIADGNVNSLYAYDISEVTPHLIARTFSQETSLDIELTRVEAKSRQLKWGWRLNSIESMVIHNSRRKRRWWQRFTSLFLRIKEEKTSAA